jgi:hypothetical protein
MNLLLQSQHSNRCFVIVWEICSSGAVWGYLETEEAGRAKQQLLRELEGGEAGGLLDSGWRERA